MATLRTVKVGDRVALTEAAARRISGNPIASDKKNFTSATVVARDDQNKDGTWRQDTGFIVGGLEMDRDLRGFRWWNELDVRVIPKEK